jgi:ABC-type phosphate transport system substrate-binding protein
MKKTKLIIRALALSGAFAAMPALAGDLFVIANNSLELSADDIREIFIGDKQISAGSKVVPMDNAALQKDFIEKALKLDPTKYASIWTKKGFRDGLNPPPVKSGDAEVIAAVKSTPGAISYVSSLPAGVKLVKKF